MSPSVSAWSNFDSHWSTSAAIGETAVVDMSLLGAGDGAQGGLSLNRATTA